VAQTGWDGCGNHEAVGFTSEWPSQKKALTRGIIYKALPGFNAFLKVFEVKSPWRVDMYPFFSCPKQKYMPWRQGKADINVCLAFSSSAVRSTSHFPRAAHIIIVHKSIQNRMMTQLTRFIKVAVKGSGVSFGSNKYVCRWLGMSYAFLLEHSGLLASALPASPFCVIPSIAEASVRRSGTTGRQGISFYQVPGCFRSLSIYAILYAILCECSANLRLNRSSSCYKKVMLQT
jgi:hypothetical protein